MNVDFTRYSALDLRHFRLLVAVTEEKSLTSAARRLRLTTSALSHQLRQLEGIANTRIFAREGKSMRPTRAGEMLIRTAERVLEIVYEAEEQLTRGRVDGEVIRLCTHCYTGYHWLPAVLRGFAESHPAVDLMIAPEETRNPFTALHAKRLDLVLSFNPPSDRTLATQFLFRDDLILLVSRKHRLARSRFVDLREFSEEHLIQYALTINESYFVRQHLAPANIRPKRFTGMPLTEGTLEMVRANLGVAVLARWATQNIQRDGVVAKQLTKQGLRRNWYAITREQPAKSSALAALISKVREDMRRFASRGKPPGRGPDGFIA